MAAKKEMSEEEFGSLLRKAHEETYYTNVEYFLNNFNTEDRLKVINELLLEALENQDEGMIEFLRRKQLDV